MNPSDVKSKNVSFQLSKTELHYEQRESGCFPEAGLLFWGEGIEGTKDMKDDLIKRQDVINALWGSYSALDILYVDWVMNLLKNIPSAEPERNIIRCADCKWWDRLEDGHPYGYCRACRSETHTERWEISIYRQNRYDFYCADAEPKENEDDDE